MNLLIVLCMACVTGIFTISQAVALTSIFDYYFYLMPFGMALVGLFLAAGIGRLSFVTSINAGKLQQLPLFGALTMLLGVAVYLYAASLGPSLFFLLLVIVLLMTFVSFWFVIVREKQLALSTSGVMIGLILGYVFIAYLNVDPLVIILIASFFSAALYVAQFFKKMRTIATILIVCLMVFAVFQGKQYQIMSASLGWILDQGKAGPVNIDARNIDKKIWGPVGVSAMYTLSSDERAAWLYTNGSAPGLVLPDKLASYDNAWWMQKAPLAMAIHDAVQPKSIVDIGMVPSDMVWRAAGQGGRNIYGLYGSHDWSRMAVPGLDLIRKSVVLLQQPVLSEEKKIKLPVDMIVISSGHEGKEGWVSSNGGEQVFLNQENILSYWASLDKDGVLVLLSRQQSVFLRQFFSIWAALNHSGMSDAEFLDRAWGVVPVDTATIDSPYHYALVITKKARDEKFAQAIREQVIALPVRYLFGYAITPSTPYNVFYQYDMNKVHGIFTRAISGMTGEHLTLEASSSHQSISYQFVEDVFPRYKNILILSVGVLIGIILLPFKKSRQVESIQTIRGPSVAVWMVAGGATGGLMVVALAFLIVYPSSVTQEFRLLYLGILLFVATLMQVNKKLGAITGRMPLLLAFASALVLMIYLITRFMYITEDDSKIYVGVAGIVLVLLGISLPAMQSSLMRDSPVEWVSWWWFAMATGSAAALFWSMGLYSVLGDDLLLVVGLLLIFVAGVFWWDGRLRTGETGERGVAGG